MFKVVSSITKSQKIIALAILFLSIIAAIGFDEYAILVLPFGVLFALFTVLNFEPIYFLLLATLPWAMETELAGGTLGLDVPDELLMMWLTPITWLYIASNPHLLSKKFWSKPTTLIILAHLGWIIIATLFSEQPLLSVKYALAKTWYISPFYFLSYLIFQRKENIILAFKCILIPLTIVTFRVIIVHATKDFRFDTIQASVIPFFRNHVNYSAMLSCFFPLMVGAWFLTQPKTKPRKWLQVALVIIFAGIILAYARGAWLALIAALGAMYLVKNKVIHYAVIAGFVLMFYVVLSLFQDDKYLEFSPDFEHTTYHENLDEHLAATFQGKDVSSAERLYRWVAAVRMSQDKFLTGWGPNNFYYYYKPYAVTSFKTYVSDNPEKSTTHNYFLLMLVEQGIVGVIIYALMVFIVFWYGQKVYHKQTDYFYKTLALSVVVMFAPLFINNFLSELIETDKIGSLWWMGFALLTAIDLKDETQSKT